MRPLRNLRWQAKRMAPCSLIWYIKQDYAQSFVNLPESSTTHVGFLGIYKYYQQAGIIQKPLMQNAVRLHQDGRDVKVTNVLWNQKGTKIALHISLNDESEIFSERFICLVQVSSISLTTTCHSYTNNYEQYSSPYVSRFQRHFHFYTDVIYLMTFFYDNAATPQLAIFGFDQSNSGEDFLMVLEATGTTASIPYIPIGLAYKVTCYKIFRHIKELWIGIEHLVLVLMISHKICEFYQEQVHAKLKILKKLYQFYLPSLLIVNIFSSILLSTGRHMYSATYHPETYLKIERWDLDDNQGDTYSQLTIPQEHQFLLKKFIGNKYDNIKLIERPQLYQQNNQIQALLFPSIKNFPVKTQCSAMYKSFPWIF